MHPHDNCLESQDAIGEVTPRPVRPPTIEDRDLAEDIEELGDKLFEADRRDLAEKVYNAVILPSADASRVLVEVADAIRFQGLVEIGSDLRLVAGRLLL